MTKHQKTAIEMYAQINGNKCTVESTSLDISLYEATVHVFKKKKNLSVGKSCKGMVHTIIKH